METMTRFKVLCVKQSVCCIKSPDSSEHGEHTASGKVDVVSGSNEPYPDRGHGRCIKGEKMPKDEGRFYFVSHLIRRVCLLRLDPTSPRVVPAWRQQPRSLDQYLGRC